MEREKEESGEKKCHQSFSKYSIISLTDLDEEDNREVKERADERVRIMHERGILIVVEAVWVLEKPPEVDTVGLEN